MSCIKMFGKNKIKIPEEIKRIIINNIDSISINLNLVSKSELRSGVYAYRKAEDMFNKLFKFNGKLQPRKFDSLYNWARKKLERTDDKFIENDMKKLLDFLEENENYLI